MPVESELIDNVHDKAAEILELLVESHLVDETPYDLETSLCYAMRKLSDNKKLNDEKLLQLASLLAGVQDDPTAVYQLLKALPPQKLDDRVGFLLERRVKQFWDQSTLRLSENQGYLTRRAILRGLILAMLVRDIEQKAQLQDLAEIETT